MQATDSFEGFRFDVDALEARSVIRIGIVYRSVKAARVVLSLLSNLRQEWGGTMEWRSLESPASTMSCTDWGQHCSPGPLRADAWVLAEQGLGLEFPEEAVRGLQPLMDCPSRSRGVVLGCIDWKWDNSHGRNRAWAALVDALRLAGLSILFSDSRISTEFARLNRLPLVRGSSPQGKSPESDQSVFRASNRSIAKGEGGDPASPDSDMENVLPVPHGGLND